MSEFNNTRFCRRGNNGSLYCSKQDVGHRTNFFPKMFIMLVWFFFIQSEVWQKSNGSGPNPFFDWWRLRWIYKQWLRWSQSAWQFFFKCHDVKCTKFFLFIISVLFLITNLCFKRWFQTFSWNIYEVAIHQKSIFLGRVQRRLSITSKAS